MRIRFADTLSDAVVERRRVGGDACTAKPFVTAEDLPDRRMTAVLRFRA